MTVKINESVSKSMTQSFSSKPLVEVHKGYFTTFKLWSFFFLDTDMVSSVLKDMDPIPSMTCWMHPLPGPYTVHPLHRSWVIWNIISLCKEWFTNHLSDTRSDWTNTRTWQMNGESGWIISLPYPFIPIHLLQIWNQIQFLKCYSKRQYYFVPP